MKVTKILQKWEVTQNRCAMPRDIKRQMTKVSVKILKRTSILKLDPMLTIEVHSPEDNGNGGLTYETKILSLKPTHQKGWRALKFAFNKVCPIICKLAVGSESCQLWKKLDVTLTLTHPWNFYHDHFGTSKWYQYLENNESDELNLIN